MVHLLKFDRAVMCALAESLTPIGDYLIPIQIRDSLFLFNKSFRRTYWALPWTIFTLGGVLRILNWLISWIITILADTVEHGFNFLGLNETQIYGNILNN